MHFSHDSTFHVQSHGERLNIDEHKCAIVGYSNDGDKNNSDEQCEIGMLIDSTKLLTPLTEMSINSATIEDIKYSEQSSLKSDGNNQTTTTEDFNVKKFSNGSDDFICMQPKNINCNSVHNNRVSRFWQFHKRSNSKVSNYLMESTTIRNKEEGCFIKFSKFRYIILFVSVLCMAVTRSNEISFNFTVICMTSNSTVQNDDLIQMTPSQISIVFAGGGIGAIAMVIPVVYFLHYFGPRIVFTALLMLSALGTILLPALGRWSPMWMVIARIIQGLALSAVLPLMGCISAQWAPLAEIGKFMTLLSSANQLSQIVTMPLSARLCVTSGWSSVYHLHGTVSVLFAIIFFLIFRNSPSLHPCVTTKELQEITAGAKARNKREAVPYWDIAKSKAVWAIWIAFLGNSFGFQLTVQFMPTFLNKVLDVPITRTGIAAIVPPLTQLIVKVCAGWTSDKITGISEICKIQIFNTIAMVGCGFFFLPLGFLSFITFDKSKQQIIALLCFTSSISCLGLVACGSMKSATLIARNFSHFVMAVVQIIVCVGMLLVPITVSWLAPKNTVPEWRAVFFLVFFVLLVTDIFFCKYCGAETEAWAIEKKTTTEINNALISNEAHEDIVFPLSAKDVDAKCP